MRQLRCLSAEGARDIESMGRRSIAGLAALALLLSACGSSGSTPASLATQPAAGPTSAAVAAPPAPTNFTATRKSGSVPCPSADESCSQTDLAWSSTADPSASFRIYWAGTGEDPAATCLTVASTAEVRLETKPGARSVSIFDPMAVGGGQMCYWITAVNSAGESAQAAAAGQ